MAKARHDAWAQQGPEPPLCLPLKLTGNMKLLHKSTGETARDVHTRRLPGVLVVKKPPANAGGLDPWVRIPWRRAWQPTPVFLPGESHGPRSLAGYSPQGHKKSNTSEVH